MKETIEVKVSDLNAIIKGIVSIPAKRKCFKRLSQPRPSNYVMVPLVDVLDVWANFRKKYDAKVKQSPSRRTNKKPSRKKR